MKTPLKQLIPFWAAAAMAVLVLVASMVNGRERVDVATEAPNTAEDGLQHMDLTGLKLARMLDTAAGQSAVPAAFVSPGAVVSSGAVLGRDGDGTVAGPREPAPVRPAAARREAPPLPFTYLGQMIDEGRTTVFVARGEDHYGLQPGLVIDDAYKVERITETQVTFVYVPLGVRQVLPVPSLKAAE